MGMNLNKKTNVRNKIYLANLLMKEKEKRLLSHSISNSAKISFRNTSHTNNHNIVYLAFKLKLGRKIVFLHNL